MMTNSSASFADTLPAGMSRIFVLGFLASIFLSRYRLKAITVKGNTITNDRVVLREVRTKPGEKFSKDLLIRTVREIGQLGNFDESKTNPVPKPNPADGTVDIEYTVEEKPSDQIELSGGFGGGNIIGTLGLTFNNFSLRNLFNLSAYKPLPKGDGQKLSLRGQTNGKYYQSYSFSFSEPLCLPLQSKERQVVQ